MTLTRDERRHAQRNAYGFSFFNGLFFQCAGGSILILFAREIGASASAIGVLFSFLPLCSILQPFTVRLVERMGCRKIMVTGWALRTLIFSSILFIPAIHARLGSSASVLVLMGIILAFNIARSLAMTAWYPWIRKFTSDETRGKYLSRSWSLFYIGSVITYFGAGLFIHGAELPKFIKIFALAAIIGLISTFFLSRIPERKPPAAVHPAGLRKELTRLFSKKRHRNYFLFTVSRTLPIGAFFTFTVLYMREYIGASPALIFIFSALPFIGMTLTTTKWGVLTDRLGSKPIFGICTLGLTVVFLAVLFTEKNLASLYVLGAVATLYGVFMGGSALAMVRYAINHAPGKDAVSFLMAFSVCLGLALGITPIAAGCLLDWLRNFSYSIGSYELNNYRIFYIITLLLNLIPLYLWQFVPERGPRDIGDLRGLARPLRPFRTALNAYLYHMYSKDRHTKR